MNIKHLREAKIMIASLLLEHLNKIDSVTKEHFLETAKTRDFSGTAKTEEEAEIRNAIEHWQETIQNNIRFWRNAK